MDMSSIVQSLGLQSAAGPGILALGLMLAAALAGLAAGTLGIGGGLVLVPALYVVLSDFHVPAEIRFTVAIATALATMTPAAVALYCHHHQPGTSWWPSWRVVPAAIGGGLGAFALLWLPPLAGAGLFALLALLVIGLLVFLRDGKAVREDLAAGWWIGSSLIGGFLGGATGIGASAYSTRLLTRLGLRDAPRQGAEWDGAIGLIGAGVLVLIGQGALGLPQHSLGYLNLAMAGVMAPVMFLAALFVAPHATKARKSALDKVFALFVVVSVTKMLLTIVS